MPLQFPSRALARLYSTAAPQSSREFDVLVLGAGVAGLSAFQQLRASLGAKPRVAVLEARNRPLGRLVSAKLPGSSSAAVDLGAQWLYADPLRKASLEGWLGEAGVEWDEWHPVERIVKTEVALPGSQPLEKLRVNLASRQPGAANIIFKSGLENTFSALAEGVNLHTGVEVKSVRLEGEKRGGRVKVDTNSGVYSADFVVCALPLPTLRSLALPEQPHIPETLQPRNLEKIILTLPVPVLDAFFEKATSVRVDCRAGRFTVVDLRVWGVEAAGVYLTDATARHVASYSDAEAAEFGTRLIRAAAAADGKELPDFEVKGMVTNWAVDPFAQGSFTAFTGPREEYSPLPPLSLPSSEQPYLVFAGEYNPPKGEGDIEMVGTVQGAWLSGVRAGEEAAIGFLDGN